MDTISVSSQVPSRGVLYERLRRETAPLHRDLDRALGFLLSPTLSVSRYRDVLVALHGLYRPLESQLAEVRFWPALPVATPQRARWLEADLDALGGPDVDDVALHAHVPALRTVGQAAGCLYVLEGASLGGQVIAKAIARSLGLSATTGASFFCGEGSETAHRWRTVVGWLDAVVDRGVSGDDVVVGAAETFQAFQRRLGIPRSDG